MSAALARAGFAVTAARDLDSQGLRTVYQDFIETYGLDEDNRLVFYYAGHGHTLRLAGGRDMGYIVPVDAPNPNLDARGFKIAALDMQQFDTWAKRIEARHALFLFDSCFSGSIFNVTRAVPDNIGEKTVKPVRQFITSGSADQQVPDRSIFRDQFIAGIQGEADRNADGYVTGAELGEFLNEKVVNYSRRAQTPQYGKIQDPALDKGDFVFATGLTIAPNASFAIGAGNAQGSAMGSAQGTGQGTAQGGALAATAELVVAIDRDSAELFVDGKPLGAAPNYFTGIPAGREIAIEVRSGPYSASQRLTLRPGELREISLSLELGKGNLYFQVASPSAYRLVLDGRELGSLGTGLAKDIAAGNHEV